MDGWILDWMSDYGGWAIGGLIFLENLFPPIPSELILTFGGFLTVGSELTLFHAITAATIGSVLGALLLYGIGYWWGMERLTRFLDGGWGRWLRLSAKDVRKAAVWFDRHGKATVFFCRFIPLIRSLISIPAGIARMKLPAFILLTAIGSAIWNTVLIGLGAWFGESWEMVVAYLDTYAVVAVGVLGLAVVVGWLWTRHKRQ